MYSSTESEGSIMTTESGNSTTEPFHEEVYEDPMYKIFLETYTVLSLICIAVNMSIALVILKYKRLRQEKSNIIILNWTIINSLFLICSPVTLRISHYLVSWNPTICMVEEIEYNVLLTNILLMILLTVYWYTKLYHSNGFMKLTRHCRLILICIYIYALLCLGLHVSACYTRRLYIFSEIFLMLFYLIYVVFMIIMNIIHAIKKKRISDYSNVKNIPFLLTNVSFISFLPLIITIFTSYLGAHFGAQLLIFIFMLVCIINPIYFFIVLYKLDNDFNTFFKHVFSCKCTKYDDEFIEQPVNYNNEAAIVENTC